MRLTKCVSVLSVTALLTGCAATIDVQKVTLASGRQLQLVRGRSDIAVGDCGTQLNAYLFDEREQLIDSKSERGHALHCDLSVAVIDAGGRVGSAQIAADGAVRAARALKPDNVNIENSNTQSQGQKQKQQQNTTNTNVWTGGTVTTGGSNSGGTGNNGGGNGPDDGTNGGTDNHHDNGDNN